MFRWFTLSFALVALAGCIDDKPDIGINDPHAYATTAKNGAVFLMIDNRGGADTLTGASGDVARVIEIHETAMEGGVMSMRPMTQIDIPAKGHVDLAPKGYHIMLLDLKAPLAAGNNFDLTLHFKKSGDMTFPVVVTPPGQAPGAHDHSDEDEDDEEGPSHDGHEHHH